MENEEGRPLDFSGIDTTWEYNRHTRAGVQLDARINDEARAVVQFLSRADQDFEVETQWAYFSYELSPSVTARAGRIVLPFYMHSQYTQVGYAYPWIKLPGEVYDVAALDTMEGMDLTWRLHTGPVSHDVNVLVGAMDVDGAGLPTFEVRNQHGINLRSRWGNWSTWLGYTNSFIDQDFSGVEFPNPADPNNPFDASGNTLDGHHAYFSSGGIQYDDGSLVLMAERNLLSINSDTGWFPDRYGMYVMGGYRFGRLMPHLTWARTDHRGRDEACDGSDPTACALYDTIAVKQENITLGVRYDLAPGIALKAEASRYGHFGDGGGQFSDSQANPAMGDTPDAVPDTSDPMVFRVAVDVVF